MPIRDVSPELGLITRQVAVEPSGDDDDEYDELDSESGGSVAEEQYTVEAILAQKTINNEMRYNIKWQGYEETTWEPIECLNDCQELLTEFLANERQREGKRKRENNTRRREPSQSSSPRPHSPPSSEASDEETLQDAAKNAAARKRQERLERSASKARHLSNRLQCDPSPSRTTAASASEAQSMENISAHRKTSPAVVPSAKTTGSVQKRSRPNNASDQTSLEDDLAPQSTQSSVKQPLFAPASPDYSSESLLPRLPGINGGSQDHPPRDAFRVASMPSFKRRKVEGDKKKIQVSSSPVRDDSQGRSGSPLLVDPACAVSELPFRTRAEVQSPALAHRSPTQRLASKSPGHVYAVASSSARGDGVEREPSATTKKRSAPSFSKATSVGNYQDDEARPQPPADQVDSSKSLESMKVTAKALQATEWYQQHRFLFEQKGMAIACAELLACDRAFLLRMKGKFIGVVNDGSTADARPESLALGYLLLAVGAKTAVVQEDVEVVFSHASSVNAHNIPYITCVRRSDVHVEFFRFGRRSAKETAAVQVIYPYGIMLVLSMSALRETSVSSLKDLINQHVKLVVHPASLILGMRQDSTLSTALLRFLIRRGIILTQQDLPMSTASEFTGFDPGELLRQPKPWPAPSGGITEESHELEHLGTYLRHQHQLAQHRRFFLAVDDQTFGAVEVEAEAALKRESSEALIIERGPEGQTIPSAHSSSTSSLAILNTFESEGIEVSTLPLIGEIVAKSVF